MTHDKQEHEDRRKRLMEAVENLGEHFDCVQVFVQIHDGSQRGTHEMAFGIGNMNAIYGHVRAWVDKTEASWVDLLLDESKDDDDE